MSLTWTHSLLNDDRVYARVDEWNSCAMSATGLKQPKGLTATTEFWVDQARRHRRGHGESDTIKAQCVRSARGGMIHQVSTESDSRERVIASGRKGRIVLFRVSSCSKHPTRAIHRWCDNDPIVRSTDVSVSMYVQAVQHELWVTLVVARRCGQQTERRVCGKCGSVAPPDPQR